MPALMTAADIVNRFNTIVRNSTTNIGTAPRHSSSFPNGTDPRLGSQAEPAKVVGDLPSSNTGNMAATIVFNIMHAWAMELTRVRQVHAFHLTDATPIDGGTQLTALQPAFAAYFPIPFQPGIGVKVDDAALVSFLITLRTTVNNIRTSSAHQIDIVTCHGSCHSSCHSSRTRR